MEVIFIGLGGFIGANLRYFVSDWVARWVASHFHVTLPLGTAFVNITGSCLLAIFSVWASSRTPLSQHLNLMIITGFFGAYTTFSTYANESIALFRQGDWMGGLTIIIGTNILCLLGVVLGIAIATRLWPTS